MTDHKAPATATKTNTTVPLAIIGIGCMFPKAKNLREYWANVKNGVDAVTEIPATHWSPDDYFDSDPKKADFAYAKRGAFIDPVDFDPLAYGIPPNVIEATDTSQLLGMVAAAEALKDAGYDTSRTFDRDRVSVILGVTGTLELVIPLGARLGHPIWRRSLRDAGVDDAVAEDVVKRIADSYVPWQENSFPGLLGNVVAGRISKFLDVGGTNCVVDAACASSLSAIHLAAMELESGRSDMVVTGGIDTFNDIFMYMCFSKTPALSPTGNAKPFDESGDGTILGEGLGVVVLKRLEDAQRDGDRVYAVLRSIGSSSDGKGEAIYAPSSEGQKKAIRRAYAAAGATPDTIELLEAHGTGTSKGDAVEARGLNEIYSEADREGSWCAIGSVKSQIGHTKAAAGVAGLIKAALALHHKVQPPTIKVNRPIEELRNSPLFVNTTHRPWVSSPDHPRRAALSAFGFGGSNFHCLLEEADPTKREVDWDGEVQLFTYSGSDANAIRRSVSGLTALTSWEAMRTAAMESRVAFDHRDGYRLAFVVERDRSDMSKIVATVERMLERSPDEEWSTPDGIFYGVGEPDGKLAMIFPGQGSQYVGMLRDLSCLFPQMLDALHDANEAFAEGDPRRLTDLIYPPPAFDDESKQRQEADLRAIEVAQPAIGAVSVGAYTMLQDFGITPEAVAGHSYGELMALCAAGSYDADALYSLSRLRAQLMASGGGDKGAMLAVRAPLHTVEQLVEEEKLDVVVANRNAPTQAVLSGAVFEIERALEACSKRKIQSKKIAVAAAFHSPLVAHAREPFLAALREIDFSSAAIPVFANTSAREYPASVDEARELLAAQLASPVDFVSEILAMHDNGIRTFIEVGPGGRLTALVSSILEDRDHTSIALDASSGQRSGITDLARLFAHLAAEGRSIDLTKWDAGHSAPLEPAKKPKLSVPLSGANHFVPKPSRPPVEKNVASTPAAETRQSQPKAPAEKPQSVIATQAETRQAPVVSPSGPVDEILRVTQESMLALQRMQEQTANLHAQFLSGQETAARTFQTLLEQQSRLLGLSPEQSAPAQAPAVPSVEAPRPAAPAQPAPPKAPAAVTEPAPETETTRKPKTSETSPAVAAVLLDVVAAKTGYPTDMLELDMALDADLGIDSIKRVEILSALEEQLPNAPRIEAEHLGKLQTLRSIVEHLSTGAASSAAAATTAPTQPDTATNVEDVLLAVVAEKTGYPTDMLELDMSLDADLGIDSIKRVEILSALEEQLPDAPKIEAEHLGNLQTLRSIVEHLAKGARTPVAPAPSPAAQSSATTTDVEDTLLSIVAEKTGYPTDMLELDMALDADLGIDSIKRVEILSALEEQLPHAPRIEAEHLGKLQTLRSIVGHLSTAASTVSAVATPDAQTSASADDIEGTLLSIVAEKTGYPTDMLELDMALDADLGIDSIKRVEILSALEEQLPDAPRIEAEHLGKLQTLRSIVEYLSSTPGMTATPQAAPASRPATPTQSAAEIKSSIVEVVPTDPERNRIWFEPGEEFLITDDGGDLSAAIATALRNRETAASVVSIASIPNTPIAGLVIVTPESGSNDEFAKSALFAAKSASAKLSERGRTKGAVFATVSRLDGFFGFGALETSAHDVGDLPSGSLAGLAKTAAREWSDVHCKAIDTGRDLDAAELAEIIVEEIFLDGPPEVGISLHGRVALELKDLDASSISDLGIAAGDVVVVSGGARGVTAAASIAIAKAARPTMVLLGRSKPPETEPEWLSGLTEEAEIKKAIAAHADLTSPRELQSRFESILANREVSRTLSAIEATGARAIYRSIDIRDGVAVESLMNEIRSTEGPIRGVVHGAGVLADKLIEEKTPEQFDRVWSTKVTGGRNLVEATAEDELRFLAFFSSSTARFGRVGQVDYAMANEALNKLAQGESRRRSNCRVVSFNFGPWNGGMVTPALASIFEKEGVGLIDLEAGSTLIVDELSRPGDAPVEVVVLAATSSDDNRENKETSKKTRSAASLSAAFTLQLNVADFPFLASHVMNGRAVLPMAMMLEWAAQGAIALNPGMRLRGIDDARLFKGLTLAEGEIHVLTISASKASKAGDHHESIVELSGTDHLHARVRVQLSDQVAPPKDASKLPALGNFPIEIDRIYDDVLFHGKDFQSIISVDGSSDDAIAAFARTAPPPSDWVAQPLRNNWLTDPLAIDSAFQLLILWSTVHREARSLPVSLESFRQYSKWPGEGVRINARIRKSTNRSAVSDIEFIDRQSGAVVASIEGYECVLDPALESAFRQNRLSGGAIA